MLNKGAFFYIKNLQIKKDKIGECDFILSIREKQVTETILIFMVLNSLLIFDIKPIFNIISILRNLLQN